MPVDQQNQQSLIDERTRLWTEIQTATQASQQLDPDGTPSLAAIQAQKRLEKLNDDYRDILKILSTQTTRPTLSQQTVTGPGGSVWGNDADGNLVMQVPPNADEDQKKAIENQNAAMLRNERVRNDAAGKGYLTTAERQKYELELRAQGLSENELAEKIRQFDQSFRLKDRELAISEAKAGPDIALTKSQTGLTDARTQDLLAKTPAEIAEMEGRGELTRAQAAEIRQKMQKPTVLSSGVEGQSIYTQSPTGEVSATMRAGYVPKTMGEIEARTGQINAAIQAKKTQLQSQVGSGALSEDQAGKDFDTWYSQTVQPELGTLNAAREDAQFERAKAQAEMQRQALLAAQNAGTQAISAFNAQAPMTLGPGAAQGINSMINSINKAAKLPEQDYSWMVTQQPNLQQSAEQAVNRQLAAISPLAAQQAGAPQPNYGAVNPTQVLDRSVWSAGQAAAPAPAAAGQTPDQLAAQQAYNRRMAGFQTEAATNAGGGGVNGATPFQGIGSNPMATAIAARQAAAAAPPPPAAVAAAAAPVMARLPRPAAAVPRATPAAPGLGYDPSNIPIVNPPGMGYDPSNIPLATPPPDYSAMAGQGVSGLGYDPSWQGNPFPGIQGLNVNGLDVNGLNLGGMVNGIPWPSWNRP